jgi:hypothetical protein
VYGFLGEAEVGFHNVDPFVGSKRPKTLAGVEAEPSL